MDWFDLMEWSYPEERMRLGFLGCHAAGFEPWVTNQDARDFIYRMMLRWEP